MYNDQIYIVVTRDMKFAKLGWTSRLHKRFLSLCEDARTWKILSGDFDDTEELLVLLVSFDGDTTLERFIHAKWSDYRVHREWFHFTGALRTWAMSLVDSEEAVQALIAEQKSGVLTKMPMPGLQKTARVLSAPKKKEPRRMPEKSSAVCSSCWGNGEHREWCWRRGTVVEDPKTIDLSTLSIKQMKALLKNRKK